MLNQNSAAIQISVVIFKQRTVALFSPENKPPVNPINISLVLIDDYDNLCCLFANINPKPLKQILSLKVNPKHSKKSSPCQRTSIFGHFSRLIFDIFSI